jgi:hypothetical protein
MSVIESVLVSVVSSVVIVAALIGWCRPVQRALIRRAAAAFPPSESRRFMEEWWGELQYLPNGVIRFTWLSSLVLRRASMARALDMHQSAPFWVLPLKRARFLAEVLLGIMLDGVYLMSAYFWLRFVEYITGQLDTVSVFDHWALTLIKVVFSLGPTVLVLWYVVIDLIGSIRRIWQSRRD